MASETGKQRSQRIELDYYKKRDGLDRWRWVCILIGLVGGVGYAAYVIALSDSPVAVSQLSTGELTAAHAHFEADCRQCHRDFSPIDPDTTGNILNFVGGDRDAARQELEVACNSCHAAGPHHRDVMRADWQAIDQNCAGCHADHQGRMNDLNRVENQKCVVCHDNLAAVCQSEPKRQPNITGFSEATHGDFASLKNGDPGRLKFDHAQHLMPGQVEPGQRGGMTFGSLDAGARHRYGDGDDGALVDLSDRCDVCHEPTGAVDPQFNSALDQEQGRYFKPVSFEKHCQACHPLVPAPLTAGSAKLPHAAPWDQVDLLLSANLVGARATGQSRIVGDDTNRSPLPGTGAGVDRSSGSPLVDQGELENARAAVRLQCDKCHVAEDYSDQAIAAAAKGELAAMVPNRWLKRGLYDHAAHASVACDYCHSDATSSHNPRDVMIDGIEKCQDCHREVGSPLAVSEEHANLFGDMPTWGSDSCILCHRYHDQG